jgi:hypothetical protein
MTLPLLHRWFELVDIIHKLVLTGIIVFLPQTFQLPFGMIIAVVYFILLLVKDPYVHENNQRLHLVAQVDLFLYMLGGYIFQERDSLDPSSDLVVSVVLIMSSVGFVVLFLMQVFNQSIELMKPCAVACPHLYV